MQVLGSTRDLPILVNIASVQKPDIYLQGCLYNTAQAVSDARSRIVDPIRVTKVTVEVKVIYLESARRYQRKKNMPDKDGIDVSDSILQTPSKRSSAHHIVTTKRAENADFVGSNTLYKPPASCLFFPFHQTHNVHVQKIL
jgi:hypothetical protein